jgi:hypothetical protein
VVPRQTYPDFAGVCILGFRCDAEGVFSDFSVITSAKSRKRHSKWSGVFAVLRWSLASQICGGRRFFPPYLLQAVPAGHSLFKGPLCLRMLLLGVCFSLGWPDVSPAAGTSLAP